MLPRVPEGFFASGEIGRRPNRVSQKADTRPRVAEWHMHQQLLNNQTPDQTSDTFIFIWELYSSLTVCKVATFLQEPYINLDWKFFLCGTKDFDKFKICYSCWKMEIETETSGE